MACEGFKDLARRTASDKILRDTAFNSAKNLEHNRYQRDLTSMVYKFFDKKICGQTFKLKIFLIKNYTNQVLEKSRKEK